MDTYTVDSLGVIMGVYRDLIFRSSHGLGSNVNLFCEPNTLNPTPGMEVEDVRVLCGV